MSLFLQRRVRLSIIGLVNTLSNMLRNIFFLICLFVASSEFNFETGCQIKLYVTEPIEDTKITQ